MKECDGLYVKCAHCHEMVPESEWESHPCTDELPLVKGGQDRRDAEVATNGVILFYYAVIYVIFFCLFLLYLL